MSGQGSRPERRDGLSDDQPSSPLAPPLPSSPSPPSPSSSSPSSSSTSTLFDVPSNGTAQSPGRDSTDIDIPNSSATSPPHTEWIADVPADVLRGLHKLGPSSTDIPRSCLKRWAHLLGHCLADLNSRLRRGEAATFAPIAAIAAIILAVPHSADAIHARMDAVRRSDWQSAFDLSESAAASRRPRGTHSLVARASVLMERKAVRKAVAALQRQPVIDTPSAIAASIKAKLPPQRHTWQRIPAPLSFAPSNMQGTSVKKWQAKVWAALCSTAPCAAPGPSALRREHVEVAARIPSARIPEHLANIVGAICAGMVPADDRFITASVISPVPKKEPGDFRPIGVGEIFRRIAGRIGLTVLLEHVGPALHAKRQFGTSRDGGHHVYDTVRRCAAEGQFVVGIDLANAFCTVDRERVLHVVQGLPDVSPLVGALYGNNADMIMRSTGDIIVSDRGVVQGCPLASVLFSMTIQPAIDEARSQLAKTGLTIDDVWYADDGTVASHSASALHAFLGYLRVAMAERGLAFSTKKAKFIAPANIADDHEDVRLLEQHAVRVPLIVCVGLPVCPLGQPDAETRIAHHFDEVVSGAIEVVTKFKQLEHPQHIIQALATAGSWSRLQYYIRGYAGVLPIAALHRGELADIDTLRVACGRHASSVDIPQWLVATLPLRDGGLGIHSVSVESAIHSSLRPPIPHNNLGPCPPPPKQVALRAARDHVALATKDTLRGNWTDSKVAAMMDRSNPGGSAWLSAYLNRQDGTLITDRPTAAAAIAQAIGCDVLPAGYPCLRNGESCRTTDPPLCDPAGQHVTNCAYLFTRRHHAIRDLLMHELETLAPHVTPLKEQGCRQDGEPYDPPNDEDRVGDVVIRDHARSSWIYIDVVVGGLAKHLIPKAILKRGTYPNAKHEEKMKDKRRVAVLHAKQQHVILAFGPTGAPSYHTKRFLGALARIIDPAHHGTIGTGKGAYTTAQRLLAKCQIAIVRSTAQRVVALGDELLHGTDPRHYCADTAHAVAVATAQSVSGVREQLRKSNNLATRTRLSALGSIHGPDPSQVNPRQEARSENASTATDAAAIATSPNQPHPHRRPSSAINLTVLRGGGPADGGLDDQYTRCPSHPAGASAAGAAGADATPPDAGCTARTPPPGPWPRPVIRNLMRQTPPAVGSTGIRRAASYSAAPRESDSRRSTAMAVPDASRSTTAGTHQGVTTTNANYPVVKAHDRKYTDAQGNVRWRYVREHTRMPRGTTGGAAPIPVDASPPRDSSHTSNGQRGEQNPRREGHSSRSSSVDSVR